VKTAQPGSTWFFVDESGDPTFYDRGGNLIVGTAGCSPILILGFVETQKPDGCRRAILELKQEIVAEPYFADFPSIQRTAVAFHAKDDVPEIRYRFFKLLSSLDFEAQVVVARKVERVFRNTFEAKENAFYDYLLERLFQNMLHRHEHNWIYFAKRGSRSRQAPLLQAIQKSIQAFEGKWGTHVTTDVQIQAQTPKAEPCLSIIDYVNWAIYRAFTKGEMHYYRAIEDKFAFVLDLYDIAKYPGNWYNRKNPFDVTKITPL